MSLTLCADGRLLSFAGSRQCRQTKGDAQVRLVVSHVVPRAYRTVTACINKLKVFTPVVRSLLVSGPSLLCVKFWKCLKCFLLRDRIPPEIWRGVNMSTWLCYRFIPTNYNPTWEGKDVGTCVCAYVRVRACRRVCACVGKAGWGLERR